MLDLTGTSELREKNEPKRLDLVLICTSVDCNLRTAMSTGKCCRAACKRPLCRWPNLAQASERTSSNDKNPRHSRPPRRTRQCPRRYLPRDPHYLLHQETSREPQPRASPANAHPFFKPEFSHWHRSCSLFHVSKSELPGWPGRQKWLTPRCRTLGSKPEACRRSWPCDIRGYSEVGLAAGRRSPDGLLVCLSFPLDRCGGPTRQMVLCSRQLACAMERTLELTTSPLTGVAP